MYIKFSFILTEKSKWKGSCQNIYLFSNQKQKPCTLRSLQIICKYILLIGLKIKKNSIVGNSKVCVNTRSKRVGSIISGQLKKERVGVKQ